MVDNIHKAYADKDVEIIRASINLEKGDDMYDFEDIKYPFNPFDIQFWKKNEPSIFMIGEIKGRNLCSTDYNDVIINKSKADFLLQYVNFINEYSSKFKCKGMLFWIYYKDRKIFVADVSEFIKGSEIINKNIALDLLDNHKVEKQMYKSMLYINGELNKCIHEMYFPNDIKLFD